MTRHRSDFERGAELDGRIPGVVPEEVLGSPAGRERPEALEVGEIVGGAAELRELLRRRFDTAFGLLLHECGVGRRAKLRETLDVDRVTAVDDVVHGGDVRRARVVDDLDHLPAGRPSFRTVEWRRGRDPQAREQDQEPEEARAGDEEPEPGAEVRAEQQVHRTTEQPDRRQHDQDTEDRRIPEVLVAGRVLGEHRDHTHAAHPPVVVVVAVVVVVVATVVVVADGR